MKNKLIELIKSAYQYHRDTCDKHGLCVGCPSKEEKECRLSNVADHLLANGVTIQRWIPVEERLPDVNRNKYTAYEQIGVIVRIKGCKKSYYRIYDRAPFRNETVYRWKYPHNRISDEEVTHWMPLPEPPKED